MKELDDIIASSEDEVYAVNQYLSSHNILTFIEDNPRSPDIQSDLNKGETKVMENKFSNSVVSSSNNTDSRKSQGNIKIQDCYKHHYSPEGKSNIEKGIKNNINSFLLFILKKFWIS